MTFKPEHVNDFLKNFNENKQFIRKFDGCRLLELYRDKNNANQYFTYSYWETEMHLEQYRNSELFNCVWHKTKKLFSEKPQAWSVDLIEKLQ
jgi:heme-degrading monooxygenase HmoA